MHRTKLKSLCGLLFAVIAPALLPGGAFARATAPGVLRLPSRSISVGAPKFAARQAPGHGKVAFDVTMKSVGSRAVAVRPSDFTLSAGGDIFAARGWNAGRRRIKIGQRHSDSFRLT